MTNLQVDNKHERRGSNNSKGLVIRGGFSILPHGLQEGSIGYEEDDEWDEDAVEQADEEILVIEKCPLLTRQVEPREFQAEFVINILERKRKEKKGKEREGVQ